MPLVRKSVFTYKKQTRGPPVSRGSVRRLRTDRVITFFSTRSFSRPLCSWAKHPRPGAPQGSCNGSLLGVHIGRRLEVGVEGPSKKGTLTHCQGQDGAGAASAQATKNSVGSAGKPRRPSPTGLPPEATRACRKTKHLKAAQGHCPSGPEAPGPGGTASSAVHTQMTRENCFTQHI